MSDTPTGAKPVGGGRLSYGQTGQDILADFLMKRHKLVPSGRYVGTYVDFGCNHPISGSDTYLFYNSGWSGLCVDADPALCEAFPKVRPRDTVVNCGIGAEERTLDFYIFENSQHNTFNAGRADRFPARVVAVKPVAIRTADAVLAAAGVTDIDFMSVDVEGFEMEVLLSMNLRRFRPKLLLMEALFPLARMPEDKVRVHLEKNGYILLAHTGHDAFYMAQ